MSIKRKMRRHQKVVNIREPVPEVADIGIASLIKGSDMTLQEAVMFLLDRSVRGIWIPVVIGKDNRSGRIGLQIARDAQEAKEIRDLIIEKTEMAEEDFGRMREEFLEIFNIYKIDEPGDD